MNAVFVSLSQAGLFLSRRLAKDLPARIYGHENCNLHPGEISFSSILQVAADIFFSYSRIVFFAPAGVVVRAISGLPRDKHFDPAIVQVDPAGRFAVSFLSGHEGGANELAFFVAGRLGAIPVVSTGSDVLRDIVVGVGCRRGTAGAHVYDCILNSLGEEHVDPLRVRILATAGCKRDEPGIYGAAERFGVPVHVVPDAEIKRKESLFTERALVREKIGLPGVSEPAALLAGHGAELIGARRLWPQVSVAIARESFMWSE